MKMRWQHITGNSRDRELITYAEDAVTTYAYLKLGYAKTGVGWGNRRATDRVIN
jgi:hypothetical protein